MDEIWKAVPGYEGLYEVSDLGRVRSLPRKTRNGRFRVGKILRLSVNSSGYPMVSLSKDNRHKNVHVHRLVAEAFIPNQYNLPQVNHIDEDKTNNRVENLEWCSSYYNMNYGDRNRKSSESLSKQVGQYNLEGELIRVWSSTVEAGRSGFVQQTISQCCRGIHKTHKGFIWRYIS